MKKKLTAVICLTIIISAVLYSCQSGDSPGVTTTAGPEQANINPGENIGEPAAALTYDFPEADYGGADFTIISSATKVWTDTNISDIVVEEEIGEVLNDAIYNRNMQIEEIFNLRLRQTEIDPNDVIGRARRLITAGDDTHDAMFISHSWGGAMIGTIAIEGGLYNLAELAELQFDKPWWTRNVNGQLKIGSSSAQYFAMNDIVVHGMQAAMMLYFNESMLQDLGLDLPYDLVRGGKWTLDEFEKYLRAGTNLNSDGNWSWSESGTSIYGLSAYHMGATALLIGTDVRIIGFDSDNLPYLAVENDHFHSAVQRLADILSVEGHYLYQDAVAGLNRIEVFQNERALMFDGHLGNAAIIRDMETPFGIMPMPKYDANQANYHALMHGAIAFTVIPVTNANPEKAASVLDAMAFLSYRDVRPAYFEVALPHKHLRNEDSIDMLQIILDARSVHIGYVYGWTNDFLDNHMRAAIQTSNPNTASILERTANRMSMNIETTVEFFE